MTRTRETPFLLALRDLAGAFVAGPTQRENEETITTLRDGSPEWMRDAVYAAHDALGYGLPNDWCYAACSEVASSLADHAPVDADAAREASHEVADGAVDVYHSARTKWLADHHANVSLVDQACEELGVASDASIYDRIATGQHGAYLSIVEALISACDSEAHSRKEAFGERIARRRARPHARGES